MPAHNGNTVKHVMEGSPAERAGVLPGDKIKSINRHRIRDSIDLLFHSGNPELSISYIRRGKTFRTSVQRDEGEPLGIELKHFTIKRCKNRCIFCFVHQLPGGLRKTLYVKDEDYRMSFLYGNYITLSNLSATDRKRIVEQRLSPLYISVHTTNRDLRNRMLGNKSGVDILKELRRLAKHRIRIHTQIVLCPGYNDGEELVRTINDLQRLYPYVTSIAVVPVGLTRHRKNTLDHVGKDEAAGTIRIIGDFQKRFLKRYGDPLVYGSDELYIKAGKTFPPLKNYGDFPQIENGVGMVPLFLSRMRKALSALRPSEKHYITITGTSFYPFLKKYTDKICNSVNLKLLPVANRFFGDTVTVTGLLTGRDIIHELSDMAGKADYLLLPDIILRDGEDTLLDSVSVQDLERILEIKVRVIESTPEGLIKGLEE